MILHEVSINVSGNRDPYKWKCIGEHTQILGDIYGSCCVQPCSDVVTDMLKCLWWTGLVSLASCMLQCTSHFVGYDSITDAWAELSQAQSQLCVHWTLMARGVCFASLFPSPHIFRSLSNTFEYYPYVNTCICVNCWTMWNTAVCLPNICWSWGFYSRVVLLYPICDSVCELASVSMHNDNNNSGMVPNIFRKKQPYLFFKLTLHFQCQQKIHILSYKQIFLNLNSNFPALWQRKKGGCKDPLKGYHK